MQAANYRAELEAQIRAKEERKRAEKMQVSTYAVASTTLLHRSCPVALLK